MSIEGDIAGIPGTGLRQLGDFVLLEEIGRGGMGMVYRARQVSLDREVALKVLPSFQGLDPDAVLRFQREAEAAGRLSHPGIVPVLAVGQLDGTYFYAMELVDGPSLFHLLDSLQDIDPQTLENSIMVETAMSAVYPGLAEKQLPEFHDGSRYPASCAALILQLAGALHVAHQGKVVHRDLKPSNILLHPDGRPVLVDFGLARDELAYSMTQTGDAVGTPAYMAPEQAAGEREADARIDVYGLGATLYEMLTLQPPFVGNHSAEIMQAILDEDPLPPRRLNPRIPKALETIVLCCLAKQPDDRYDSAAALQSDLRAYLAGGVIRARREGLIKRAQRHLQRNRRSAYVAAASVLFALLVGLMVGLVSLNNARQEGRRTLEEGKILLIQGDVRGAHAAYAQAEVLLESPELVATQRLDDLFEVFPVHYRAGRYGILRDYLDGLPTDQMDRPAYHRFRRRLEGIGTLHLDAGELVDLRVDVRAADDAGLAAAWQALPDDGALAAGAYLLRLQAESHAPLVRAVELQRDAELQLSAPLPRLTQVPPGMVAVLPPGRSEPLVVARTELSIGKYADLLARIKDRQLAAEMLPLRWLQEGRSYMPVTGLSFRQARAAAALLGGHLPDEVEYLAAGNCGLAELRYPWGREWDVNRVVGDPRYTSEMAPATSRPKGASPLGVLHLVGNAAEILAGGPEQPWVLAGGHYLATPDQLHLGARQLLPHAAAQLPYAGMRLARFLIPDSPAADVSAFAARRAAVLAAGSSVLVRVWQLDDQGGLRLEETLPAAGAGPLERRPPAGFLAAAHPELRGAGGTVIPVTGALAHPRAQIPTSDAGQRLSCDWRLLPLAGLQGSGAGYSMRLPLSGGLDILRLPTGCRVDEVWPEPDWRLYQDGATVLAWGQDEGRVGRAAVLRFRRDGALTSEWPATAPVQAFVQDLFTALERRDRRRLRELVAARAVLFPQGWDCSDWLQNLGALERFRELRLQDVLAVGDVLAVELLVDWQTPATMRIQGQAKDWPLRLYLQRDGAGQLRLLRMGPRVRVDQGLLQARSYRHPGLKISLRAPDETELVRGAEGMTAMQVLLRPADGEAGTRVQLHACLGSPEEDPASIRQRLIAGLGARGRGERVSNAAPETLLEQLGGQVQRRDEDWLFRDPDGAGFRRESWTFLSLGHRHLLLRAVAVGKSRNEARRRFRSRRDWFHAVAVGLQIH